MTKKGPILNYNDPRVKRLWTTHACLGKRGNEFKFFNMDNFPDNWERVKVVDVRQSGKTISESIFDLNEQMRLRGIKIKKVSRKK